MEKRCNCGELTAKDIGKEVSLYGWVHTKRTYPKLIFIDLRDRYGITQIVVKENSKAFPEAEKAGQEYVLSIKGRVQKRQQSNPKLATGEIEVSAENLEILNVAESLPISVSDENKKISDETKQKYRYLDLRRSNSMEKLIIRHKAAQSVRKYLNSQGFIEVETPFLAKSTPEGARDFLVPSRIHKGKFYALPQSPQLYKQTLMVAGLDKYYQIVRCFRDEDFRANRQPEFTQIDIEMSFPSQEDIMNLSENLIKNLWKEVLGIDLGGRFPRMTYDEAMKRYKTDKPDLRKDKNNKNEWAFVWITGFPMFEYSKEERRLVSRHHPFTAPLNPKDLEAKDTKKLLLAKSQAYDLVLNGEEIGGGSIRIHKPELQRKVFEILGLERKKYEQDFGFLLKMLSHGAPPHGGIAFGFDRIVMFLAGTDNIREVIAFPKNKQGQGLMEGSPSEVSEKQLKELKL